jgi:hypothetical protein
LGGEPSSALWINADFEEKNSIKNEANFRRMTIYCLHLFQGVIAIFFRTMDAESTWNFKKKLLLVFEVGSFWQFFRIFSFSAVMTLHVSFECWWVPILVINPSIMSCFRISFFSIPSKKLHNIWGLKD